MNRAAWVLVALLLSLGCTSRKEAPRTQGNTSTSSAPVTSVVANPTPTVSTPLTGSADREAEREAPPSALANPDTQVPASRLPTAEDFEEEAEKKLTSANLEQELDQLEREIGK